MDKEQINRLIDAYHLRFLDDFEQEQGRLPNELELISWRIGFADGLYAIGLALFTEDDLTGE